MNIDEILNYKHPKENYYHILGCHQSSSIEQINREYKLKALQLHPDKNPDPHSLERFRQVQTAKDILTNEASRKSYDVWLNSGIHVPFEQWNNRKAHSMMHWASPKSTKLTIKEASSTQRQGSEFKLNNPDEMTTKKVVDNSWLEKFRKYEV